jgi:hypothetical protein
MDEVALVFGPSLQLVFVEVLRSVCSAMPVSYPVGAGVNRRNSLTPAFWGQS